ncbi:hypothetical protein SALBM217S_09594 [Streptomyces griseoloalbus]
MENITSNSGLRSRARVCRISCTSRSNGIRSCEKAPTHASRTTAAAVPNPPDSGSLARSTSVFAKNPTSPSASGWCRPATGVPTTTSSWPVTRASVAMKPVSSTMNSVPPDCLANSSSAAVVAPSRRSSTRPPSPPRPCSRGRSTGSSSGAVPDSVRRQWAISSSIRSPATCSSSQPT